MQLGELQVGWEALRLGRGFAPEGGTCWSRMHVIELKKPRP